MLTTSMISNAQEKNKMKYCIDKQVNNYGQGNSYLLSFPFKRITLPLCFYFLSVTVFETDLQLTNRCIYIDIFVYIERLVLVETAGLTANHKCMSILNILCETTRKVP